VALLAQIPIEPSIADGGDRGAPASLGDGPAASVFGALADRIVTEVLPPLDMEGCTARMLAAVEAAVGE
jgi:ATP-binding protein involved in chromosome partitioning